MKDLQFKFGQYTINENERPLLCGILNVTPDSFSDGGRFFQRDAAIKRGLELINQGAEMLDIGGESTRPGSCYVEVNAEIERVVPVIEAIKEKTAIPISIDTWKAEVAREAIKAGADIVNDITGFLGDPHMAGVVGNTDAGAVLMFNPVIARPDHESARVFPKFGAEGVYTPEEEKENLTMPILDLMFDYFRRALVKAKEANIEDNRIMLDPGIGFGLTQTENLTLINEIERIKDFGYLAYLGVSRKRFLQNILAENSFASDANSQEGFTNRDLASAYFSAIASSKGVSLLRVHDILPHKMAVAMGTSLFNAKLSLQKKGNNAKR